MRLDCALLCDAATVREGLLHILGGGITRIARPEPYPVALDVFLALRIVVDPGESKRSHQSQILLQSDEGKAIAELRIEFAVGPGNKSEHRPGEEIALPIAARLHGIGVPAPGAYSFEVLIDGIHQSTVPFVVVQAPELSATGRKSDTQDS
ncbi:MAG: hypothetical protein JO115_18800 [Pseudonocardiales bacterium]|nr:hypothetical protein [Pseudonocardiales bacterium]